MTETSSGEEQELPRMPVPDLNSTLDKYLFGLKAVIVPSQYEQTRNIVEEFRKPEGEGCKLQECLLKYAETRENWVTDLWLDDMYLCNPLPLPVNSNPFFLLPKQHFRNATDQYRFASKLVVFALRFKKQLDSGDLRKDYGSGHGKGRPLCMQTYHQFFSAYRRPGLEKDELFIAKDDEQRENSRHIIVAVRNQFYVLNLPTHDIPSEDEIAETLQRIVHSSKEESASSAPVGVLTTENRRTWAALRNQMSQSETNQESLHLIEVCLFVLCLDDYGSFKSGSQRRDSTVRNQSHMAAYLLHGYGGKGSGFNRWYDKFLQIIVSRDGVCGLVCEHSASEGITVLRFCEEFLQHHSLVEDLDLYVLTFCEYGKDFIKAQKMSPDCYIQLALQLTFFKVHRRLVSTYESASLRQFRLGRVDNIRAATPEVLAWVRAMCDQVETTTISGYGPDNHLLGLREMAKTINDELPAIFRDKSYQDYLDFRLSTSQLPTESNVLIGYGPVVPDGYGCSYNPRSNHIVFCISSFFTSEETSSDFFALSLEGSLLQMRELFHRSNNIPRQNGENNH